ncbi:MAG: hypothetical protein IKN04_17220 [Clostridia bacterium]|nr:hypothetical protein [Clostridia bacterium]
METKEKEVPVLVGWRVWCESFGGTKAMFYRLVNREDVPAVSIGGRKFLLRDGLEKWLAEQSEQKA